MTSGGTTCPDGSFSTGQECSPCSSSCQTCNGPSSNNCIVCAAGQSLFNSSCVTTDSNGICEGSNGMIADNNKQECDSENYFFISPRCDLINSFSLWGQMHVVQNSKLWRCFYYFSTPVHWLFTWILPITRTMC